MSTNDRYMDIAEFRELGYLQEVNRRLLHPLGLALEAELLPDGTERLGGIWDCRDDPEGAYYGPGAIDPEKAERVDEELVGRYDARQELLGFFTQPADAEEWHIPTHETAPASDSTAARARSDRSAP